MKKYFVCCQHYCQKFAKSFYFASQFLPHEKREAAYAVYAFCRRTDNIIDSKNSISSKKKQLKKWKNELENAWNNKKTKNSILSIFVSTCKKYFIPKEWGFALIERLERDFAKEKYKTFEELEKYCFSAGAIPGLFMAQILNAPPKAQKYAIALGIGMQLTNILRDIKADYAMGRIYLPQNEMKVFDYTEKDIENEKINENFIRLMQFQVFRAKKYYDFAERGISLLNEEVQLPMKLCLSLYKEILHVIEQKNYDVFSSRVQVSMERKKEILASEQKDCILIPAMANP